MRVAAGLTVALSLWAGPAGQRLEDRISGIQQAIEAGRLQAAWESIAAALGAYPRVGGLYNLRGIVEARRGAMAAARADFERAVELEPELLPGWQNLGRACQALAGSQNAAAACAAKAWREVLRRRPGDGEARLALATVYEWEGKFAESLGELQRLPAEEAGRAAALSLRCADLAGLGRWAEAGAAARRLAAAADFGEGDAEAVYPVLKKKEGAPVMVTLGEALDARGQASQKTLERLARAYEQLNRMKDARRVLERVAATEPREARHLLELARVAYLEQDREGALGYLAHARELTPGDARVHFLFGMIAVEMNLPVEAKKSLERALALDPENPRYQYALGGVALTLGDGAEALKSFRRYLAARPDDPRGHFAAGVAYFASGDMKAARAEMERVREKKETEAGAEYFLGRIARTENRLDQAAGHLERAIELLPNMAEPRAELARVRLDEDRIDEARTELKRALALESDNFQANAALLTLYQRTRDARLKEQAQRLKELEAKRSARQELMLRTIEVKPY